jgi:hypothetical protein
MNTMGLASAAIVLISGSAAHASWSARVESRNPLGASTATFAQVEDGTYTSGPPGSESSSELLSLGTVQTTFQGRALASLESRRLEVYSTTGAFQSARISDELFDLENQTNAVTLYYMAKWVPFAGLDFKEPGNAGTISLQMTVFYPTLGSETVADWTIDLLDTPCPYVNQDCRTSDLIVLKEIPDRVTYSFGLTSDSSGLTEEYHDYFAELKVGFGEILRCPSGFGGGFCVVPVPHKGGPGVGPGGGQGGNGFWPPVTRVPEPSAWLMLIAGFGLIGASARRRRTREA